MGTKEEPREEREEGTAPEDLERKAREESKKLPRGKDYGADDDTPQQGGM